MRLLLQVGHPEDDVFIEAYASPQVRLHVYNSLSDPFSQIRHDIREIKEEQ